MSGRTWGAWAAALLLLSVAGCGRDGRDAAPGEGAEHESAGADAGEAHGESRSGPHGGRLFEAEGLRLELLLAGEEGPPTFSAYLFDAAGRPLRPTEERLGLALERLGGRRDSVAFRIDGDHLHSTTSIAEPHSFAVEVTLRHGGRVERWSFEQVESRVELAPEAIRASGIEVGRAGPASIQVTIEAPGEVRLNSERVVHIRPRFAGQVEQLRKRLGDSVRRGEVLALVHSNESLADYEITAPMDGTVVGQESAAGQAVDASSVIFTLADLSSVWVDFPIYPQTAGRVRVGQPVAVRSESGPALSGAGTVRYVGPLLEQDTRVSYGRVVLDNRDRRWQPGLYVTCAVTVERVAVPVAVPEEAIVRMREGPAVFRAAGNLFEPQTVLPGRSDGRMTEIVAGLEPGAPIVVAKAFLLKAELGKGESGHEH